MSETPRMLEAMRLPLHGRHLVEASAGTGKTHTLADLYLRLVIEAGHEVDRILVVTFTKAATAELKTRIRRRLTEARARLAAAAEPSTVSSRHRSRPGSIARRPCVGSTPH